MDFATGTVQARGIYQVALILKLFLGKAIEEPDIDSLTDKEIRGIAGLTCSFVVLRALAAELALKVLYSQQTVLDATRTHDLSKLFQVLPSQTRNSIGQRFQSKGTGKTVENVFANHKDDFVDWRYVYQDPNQHTDFGDLEYAIEAVLEELGV